MSEPHDDIPSDDFAHVEGIMCACNPQLMYRNGGIVLIHAEHQAVALETDTFPAEWVEWYPPKAKNAPFDWSALDATYDEDNDRWNLHPPEGWDSA